MSYNSSYRYFQQADIDKFEKEFFDDKKLKSLADVDDIFSFADQIKKSYKFSEKGLGYMESILTHLREQNLDDPDLKALYFKTLRKRASLADHMAHKHRDNYGLDLLRALRDEQYNGEKNEEEITQLLQQVLQCKRYVSKDNLQVFDRESKDIALRKGMLKRGSVTDGRPVEALRAEAEVVRKMVQDYEATKMDVQPDSVWYVMSLDWFNRWKLYVGFDGEVTGEFPGPCSQDDIMDDEQIPIVIDQDNMHLNINLKDNLREETHFTIVNEAIWQYL